MGTVNVLYLHEMYTPLQVGSPELQCTSLTKQLSASFPHILLKIIGKVFEQRFSSFYGMKINPQS